MGESCKRTGRASVPVTFLLAFGANESFWVLVKNLLPFLGALGVLSFVTITEEDVGVIKLHMPCVFALFVLEVDGRSLNGREFPVLKESCVDRDLMLLRLLIVFEEIFE